MNKKLFFPASFICLATLYQPCFASSHSQIGRYLTVENKPALAQVDLLSQSIQVRFPQTVQTIGDAMNYVLRFSGYGLVPSDLMNKAFKMTLIKLLPAVDRNFGPMSLKDALTTLVGPAFFLVHDPLNRTIDFRVKPQFAKLYADALKTPSKP